MTCAVLSHLPVCSHVCVARMRPALCGPHASRIVWPAFTPALALALAAAPARPVRPRLGAGCVHSVCADYPEPAVRARAFPACPTACSPSCLSLLSGAARSAPPRWLIDFRLPAGTLSCRPQNPRSSPRRRYHRSLPSRCARMPSLGPRGAAPVPQFRRLPSVFT